MVTPNMMRQLWALVESTQVTTLLQFEDSDLVQFLLKRFRAQQSIDAQDVRHLDIYIQSKLPLIRDLAEDRSSVNQGSH
jgi:succinate dehydrogenase flavin-adding protein (antitoxin of CptAB toxin-antitoxin module)